MPIIATLYVQGGLRFAELARRLGSSRDTLSETLTALVEAGIVRHNDFFGQPVRPEYTLTERGRRLGEPCLAAVGAVRDTAMLGIALKKWPMLALVAVGRGASRYNELKGVLTGITSRALAMALKDLEEAGLVERTVAESYPPSVHYRLTDGGLAVFPTMDVLVTACEEV